MDSPSWIRALLRERQVPFQEFRHLQAFSARELARRGHISPHRVAKVVIVIADGRPVELVLPANRHIVFDALRSALHASDVRLATEKEIGRYFTDVEVGAVPPLRHWKEVDVVMDESLDVEGEILFQAGTHTDAVRLEFDDWYRSVRPRVKRFTAADSEIRRFPLPQRTPVRIESESSAASSIALKASLLELVDVLQVQAQEIEQLASRCEPRDAALKPSQMPDVIAKLSELRSRLEQRSRAVLAN
jgi:Ala-tRNA(Pro) deacylase